MSEPRNHSPTASLPQAASATSHSPKAPQRRHAPIHSADQRHHPHIRRRRKRRIRRRLFFRRYGWPGIIGVTLGGFAAFFGGLWLAAFLLQHSVTMPPSAQERDFAQVVIQTCEDTMLRVDCTCFWKRSKDAYTDLTLMPLMMALTEREQWGPAITRGRMEKVAGPEATRLIGRALYDCVQM